MSVPGHGLKCSSPSCTNMAWLMCLRDDPRRSGPLRNMGWTRDPEVEDGWLCERCSA